VVAFLKAVPNIISVFRICLVPIFVIVYFTDDRDIKFYALLVFAIAGISDILDGFIARRFKAQSQLGRLLDPLGDKLMTFTAMVCITIDWPVILWAVIVFFVKEVLMGVGGLVLHRKVKIELPPANIIGKISTIIFFITCISLMLFSNLLNRGAVTMIISVAIIFTLIALASYILSYIKIMKSREINTGNIGEIECNQQSVQDVSETLP